MSQLSGKITELRKGARGQVLIELVVILLVLFVLTLCILDMARILYAYEGLVGGAREGARYFISVEDPGVGQQGPILGEVQERVETYFGTRLGVNFISDNGQVTITNEGTGAPPMGGAGNWPAAGTIISVDVQVDVDLIMGTLLGGILGTGDTVTISTSVKMGYLGE